MGKPFFWPKGLKEWKSIKMNNYFNLAACINYIVYLSFMEKLQETIHFNIKIQEKQTKIVN